GKSLLPIDPKKQGEFHYRVGAGDPLVFATLSSGEQEVVKIVFDLISKQIRHCVVLVDEPELHLHPTLAFRLVEAMKNVGDNTNQFIFFTHSADLISTYYSSGNVYFVDLVDPEHNQARQLTALDKNHVQTARAIGANLGLFAVGKKLVFVEGTEASVDRLTYYRIAQRVFPEAYILPAGAVGNIMSLGRLSAELQRSVFGIDFFMIRDRDGLTDGQIRDLEKNPRFRCLRRRHIENYFLDAEVLALVGEQFYLDPKWRSAHQVDESLRDIATKVIGQATVFAVKHFVTLNGAVDAPSVSGADEMSVADIESELARAVRQSLTSVSEACSENALLEKFRQHRSMLEESLRGSTWKEIFPGKLVFARYCGTIRQQVSRVREAYVDIALKKKPSVFEPVETIFRSFADVV
ncbi:MAG TPA: AAA family ATPase, partial [Tepidisphaeraceae bacterium]